MVGVPTIPSLDGAVAKELNKEGEMVRFSILIFCFTQFLCESCTFTDADFPLYVYFVYTSTYLLFVGNFCRFHSSSQSALLFIPKLQHIKCLLMIRTSQHTVKHSMGFENVSD
jgi:hypothetical protein